MQTRPSLFYIDLAFGSHWYQQFSVIKSATFERVYHIGFADMYCLILAQILCLFKHQIRKRFRI